jgi:hypothetical protein
MKIQTLEVSGFIGCLESLRLPYKLECRSNWQKDQSIFDDIILTDDFKHLYQAGTMINIHNKDLKLLQTLIKKGDEHAKSVRLINVTAYIEAPLFWWNEENTYIAGITRGCSESTMHTLKKEELTKNNFESVDNDFIERLEYLIKNNYNIEYIKSRLPSGYLQARVINYNYQTLRRIWLQRRDHKLPQWKVFIDWIKTLPMSELITGKDGTKI